MIGQDDIIKSHNITVLNNTAGTGTNTGSMIGNSSGQLEVLNVAHSIRQPSVVPAGGSNAFSATSHNSSPTSAYWSNDRLATNVNSDYFGYWDIKMNISHTHNFIHSHSYSGGTETRSKNITMRLWKRTA